MTAPRAIKQCNSCGVKKPREKFPKPRSMKCSECHVSRVCVHCGERKPVEEFSLASKGRAENKGYRLKRCHPCELADKRKHYSSTGKQQRMKWQYGITFEQWEAMFEAQGRRCANPGCRATEHGGRNWCTDHDHNCCPQKSRSCGKCIRGILCFPCNVLLGCARDSEDVLLGALRYLQDNLQSTVSTRRAI